MKKRHEKGIWQRRYYDHIIRNNNDYLKTVDYILKNPENCFFCISVIPF